MVIDTGTLMLNGGVVHLNGVVGETGEPTRQLLRYMGGREVACDPVEGGDAQYRCRIGDYDLAEAVLLNGAGRAGANAPERLRNAEQQARTARRGIWSR